MTLSVFDAPGDLPAIITRDRTLAFADCARALPPPARAIIATPSIDTILAVYAALAAGTPLTLVHAKLPAAEQARQLDAGELSADTAFVLYTSGSTGRAKGVMLSRAAIVAAAGASAAGLGWRDDDRWLSCLPMAHSGGLSIVVRCLLARKPVVLHDADFDAAVVLELARSRRATLLSLVPTQLAALAGAPPPPALRAVIVGGAAASPKLVADAISRAWPILPSYGLTETFGQIATARVPGGLPVVLPGVEIIARETLCVRGPMLATGYLGGAAIAPELVTADLGSVDPDGTVHVTGRRDDVIVTGGEKVQPLDVEAALCATPGVLGACAFAVADERWGAVVGAAIAVDHNFALTDAHARWHTALANHARPRRLAIVAQLPLLASGKLDRLAIAALPTEPVVYASGDETSTRISPGAVK
ncbi:MAG TPA: AMP-binding protein [Kofleriaceae bacterium]|nr:AMP-binding protein [Kofleriaceae bacterium]